MKQTAEWQTTFTRRLSLGMSVGLIACIASIFLSLWTESAMMGDVAWLDAWPVCVQMMTTTHYGHAGVAAMALLGLALMMHSLLKTPNAGMGYVTSLTVLLLLVAVARVTIGHAYEHGPFSVAVLVEWLHLVIMALWAGIVFVAGWVVLPRVHNDKTAPTRDLAAYLTSMSNWAAAALIGILATGSYNAYRVLGSPRQFIEADYGQALLIKLCLVLVAIGLGGFNKFFGLPAALSSVAPTVQRQRGLRKVITILRIESIALLLVLIAAATLTSSAPPG